MKKEDIEVRNKTKAKHEWWLSITSTLIGMLGSIISSLSLVGLKELTSLQITLIASIFIGIVIAAYAIRSFQKAGEATRSFSRKVTEVYLTHIDHSIIKPVTK